MRARPHAPSQRPRALRSKALSKNRRGSFERLTHRRYEDPRFVEAFRRSRGERPRPYERRLLRELLGLARKRRALWGLRRGSRARVLDVGTGYGRDLAWLQAQPGIHAIGVDYAMSMLRAAKRSRTLRRRGALAQMDVRRLGIRTASVEVVRAQALFHHLSPSAAKSAMREVARVLRSGGLLRVFVRWGRQEGLIHEPNLGLRYFRQFTLVSLKKLLHRYGLRPLTHRRLLTPSQVPALAVVAEKSLLHSPHRLDQTLSPKRSVQTRSKVRSLLKPS